MKKRTYQNQNNRNTEANNVQLPTLPTEPLIFLPDKFLEEVPENVSIWYESKQEIETKIEQAKIREKLLNWVQKQIEHKLTKKERAYIEHYYFGGLTLEEISNKFKVNPSSVSRGIRRALNKLRSLKTDDSLVFHRKKMRRK
ncbi:MAG: sigma-70 family RNA polymerase sigma factor [Candidatus Hydrogenedentes bacterium]|nr:sigma-70 family RNA polymerase sigma factor [Candidatus Hydrogenedentota bacterium]